MDPKDFKFDDNAFDDVMSSSEKDKKDIKSNSFEDEFEDIFSGNDNNSDTVYRDFTDEYFSDEPSVSQPSAARRPTTPVEKKPLQLFKGFSGKGKACFSAENTR